MAVTTEMPIPTPAVGTEQWVGLEELAGSPAFQDMLHREFPEDATAWADPVTRRTFLTLAGASVALAGVGCSPRPASREKIYPYVRQPEEITLGLPLFFATGFTLGGVTTGLLAKSREGRPIKLEGNPSHPTSLGAIDSIAQSSLLDLYDPDRSRSVLRSASRTATAASWDTAVAEFRTAFDKLRIDGRPIRILTETVNSPALTALIQDEFLKAFPTSKWIQYDPVNRDNAREGARLVYGEPVNTVYDFAKAYRVVALDADFLQEGLAAVRYARDFNKLRNTKLREGGKVPTAEQMNRLYVVESMLTATGAVADHRLPVRSADVEEIARALASGVGVDTGKFAIAKGIAEWIAPVIADLQAHKGKSIVIAGGHQSPAVHALVHAINGALGNVGQTVFNHATGDSRATTQTAELKELVAEMEKGSVAALVVIGANPVFTAPADINFKDALSRVGLKIHMGSHVDETAVLCDWHVPQAHFLETWGDGRAHDGTVTLCQPLIAPLFAARSPLELVSALLSDRAEWNPREIIKSYWKKNWPANGSVPNFDGAWQRALQEGIIANTALPRVDKPANAAAIPPYAAPAASLEITFRPDPAIYDGRFLNNGWLQELPRPITKLTWDNALIVSPKTAEKYGLTNSIESTGGGEHGRTVANLAEVTLGDKKLKAAVWIQHGHADESITLHLGFGRERGGKVAKGTGFNAYAIRSSAKLWTATGIDIKGTDETYILASTQAHFRMEGRRPVRGATREEYDLNYEAWKKTSSSHDQVALFAKVPKVAAPEWQLIDKNVPGSPTEWRGDSGSHEHTHGDKKEEHSHDNRLIPLSVVPATNKEGRRWAMAIDLTACNGCSACISACIAENNIPVVGKKEVTRGREMHWIRVDRYYEFKVQPNNDRAKLDDPDNIVTHLQPVPCQQCEKAPCEVVCPVAATVHSSDGLNDMVYNRCVGTRYCSNNCPYKVRRFNFLTFADWKTDTYKLMRNPEVTVRERGIMEKCTYCVQRIRAAEIEAERTGRDIKDGEIVTACEQACPSGAIVFGDLSDPKARVNNWKVQPTNYGLLAELNTMPRTTYLAAIRNPNPDMLPKPKGA